MSTPVWGKASLSTRNTIEGATAPLLFIKIFTLLFPIRSEEGQSRNVSEWVMAVAGSNSLLGVRKGGQCQQGSKNAEARNLVNGEGGKLNKTNSLLLPAIGNLHVRDSKDRLSFPLMKEGSNMDGIEI